MNKEDEKAINSLTAGFGGIEKPTEAETDWKAKYEDVERRLQSAMVEQGRVKKLDEEKKELQRKLNEVYSAQQKKSVIDELPDSVKGEISQDVLDANAEIALRVAGKSNQTLRNELRSEIDALKEHISKRDEQDNETRKRRFADRVKSEFPGFLEGAVAEGGDKHKAWVEYQKYNAASIANAANTFDFDTLAWHIKKFYKDELGIAPPSGGTPAAAEPSNIGGGTPVATKPGKVYTGQEILDLYDEIEKARDRGDFAEVKRIGNEIDKATREGRVK